MLNSCFHVFLWKVNIIISKNSFKYCIYLYFKIMQVFRKIFTFKRKYFGDKIFLKKQCSTSIVPLSEVTERQNYLFSLEQKKQFEEVGRIEKITVEVQGPPEDVVLMMNQNVSTPYDCCRHISLPLCEQSPLALLNDKYLWDMHRPLPGHCKLKFLKFKDTDPFCLNQVFWRTGSFVLGAVITKAFKEEAGVLLHSFPEPRVSSGSFIYDVKMKLENWIPKAEEIMVLSGEFLTFVRQHLKIERLEVKKTLGLDIFEGNPYKQKQIHEIASKLKDNLVPLYRVGEHIDLNFGPMIGNTSFFGRCSVAAVHSIFDEEPFYRFQGVALPSGIMLNSFAYSVILRRAQVLNNAPMPNEKSQSIDSSDSHLHSDTLGKVYPNPFLVDN